MTFSLCGLPVSGPSYGTYGGYNYCCCTSYYSTLFAFFTIFSTFTRSRARPPFRGSWEFLFGGTIEGCDKVIATGIWDVLRV